MENKNQKVNILIGFASIGCIVSGVLSLNSALFPFASGDYLSAGVNLIAAGISFGLLAIAVLKK